MPLYRYVAVSAGGSVLKGERVAPDPAGLEQELAQQGLQLVRARPSTGTLSLRRRTPLDAVLQFVQELAALLQAGLTLPEALDLARRRPEAPALEDLLAQVTREVRGGQSFSQALAAHGEAFDALLITAVQTGERAGTLPAALARYRDDLRRRIQLRRKISQALVYPLFLLLVLAIGLGILFVVVLPRFAALYSSFDTPLPLATRILIALVDALPVLVPVAGGLGLGAWVLWHRHAGAALRLRLARWRRRIPHLGPLHELVRIAAFTRALSTLLASGTPLLVALNALQRQEQDPAAAKDLLALVERVRDGESLAAGLRALAFADERVIKLVEVGEATGALDRMLAQVAQAQEDLLDHRLGRTMALIEPLLMLVMGVVIGAVIIVMYLPIFQLATVIQ